MLYFKANIAWNFGINAVGGILDYSGQHAYAIIFPYDLDYGLLLETETDELFKAEDRNIIYYPLKDYLVLL